MKKIICVVATIGVLMSLTAIPVSAGFGFDRWPTVETRYQGSTLCNQTLAKNCYTDDSSHLISVGLRKGDSVKASTNKKLYKDNIDRLLNSNGVVLCSNLGNDIPMPCERYLFEENFDYYEIHGISDGSFDYVPGYKYVKR